VSKNSCIWLSLTRFNHNQISHTVSQTLRKDHFGYDSKDGTQRLHELTYFSSQNVSGSEDVLQQVKRSVVIGNWNLRRWRADSRLSTTANLHCRLYINTSTSYATLKPPPQPFYGPGPPGWAGARRELLDFIVQGKINRGRHSNHLAGATPSGLTSAHLHHTPFFTGGTNSVKALKVTSAFGLGRRRKSSPQRCYLHCLRTLTLMQHWKKARNEVILEPVSIVIKNGRLR